MVADLYEFDATVDPESLSPGSSSKHTTAVYCWTSPDAQTQIAQIELSWSNEHLTCNDGTSTNQRDWIVGAVSPNRWMFGDWGHDSGPYRTTFECHLDRRATSPRSSPVRVMSTVSVGGSSNATDVLIDLDGP